MVLVHGQDVGGASFAYPQPELDAPTGVVGLLEDAGYAVFNPSLPYHDSPSDAYNKSDGAVTADDYAQSLASVRCHLTACKTAHALASQRTEW